MIILGKVVGIVLGGKGQIPSIEECYPKLYDKEAIEEKRQMQSIANFRNFANAFNARYENKEVN